MKIEDNRNKFEEFYNSNDDYIDDFKIVKKFCTENKYLPSTEGFHYNTYRNLDNKV